MQKTSFRLLLLSILWLHGPLPALACPQIGNAMNSTVTVSAQDQGRLITITTGQILVVKLRGNLGTGYQWQLHKNSNSQLLQLVGAMTTEPLGPEEPGLDENFVHRLKAIGTGSGELEFRYVRPWEKDKPSQTVRLQVKVEPARS
jgi:predicted secreted protein